MFPYHDTYKALALHLMKMREQLVFLTNEFIQINEQCSSMFIK